MFKKIYEKLKYYLSSPEYKNMCRYVESKKSIYLVEGEEIGKKIGKEIGEKIGEKIGEEKNRKNIACEMLMENEPLDKIHKYTKYSIDEINELAKEMNINLSV